MFVSTCAVSAFANLQVRGTEVEPCEVTTKTVFFFVFFCSATLSAATEACSPVCFKIKHFSTGSGQAL